MRRVVAAHRTLFEVFMKLRRALAAAAATAAIAPLALLSAPAAFASDDTSSPSATVSPSDTSSASASTSASASQSASSSASASASASQSASSSASSSASQSTPAGTPSNTSTPSDEPTEPVGECTDSKADVSISGLPGKIAAGSGWHKFSLNVANNSDSTLENLSFFAGASADKNGDDLFKRKQVQLQAWNPDSKKWETLNEDGYAVGYVGTADELKPDYEIDIPMRINVTSSAPVGAGFSLGATIYDDNAEKCIGLGEIAYKFQIVAAGTDTDGTKPQEGGKAPVTTTKPSSSTPEVTGTLASTGSSSALPTIALVGGVAVVAGGGVIFAVRRRKAGGHAAA
ncbi:LPXTG cell wall anchor domain-containing protein [Streptomyces cynarae]|nr:LPXTG cell wall anchor domain-containing protein [Streptomyces cynarae]